MPPKFRTKIILESQGSRSNVVEASQEGLVLAMKEQLEKNTTSFLQEEHSSNNPIEQEAGTSNQEPKPKNHIIYGRRNVQSS